MASLKKKNVSLSLREDEILSEKVRLYPCLYDKSHKSYKEKDVVQNAWQEIAEELEFITDGMYALLFLFLYNYLYTIASVRNILSVSKI